ncbi:MAG: type II secretion system protein [Chloroflexi bacterium]|nr:type II secretion system protein [Chloroflexota bacterium]
MSKIARRFRRALRGDAKGFTLIELLVVIGMGAVIGGIVIMNIGRFIGRGCEESARIELHNIQTGAVAFMAENNGTVPTIQEVCTDYLVGSPPEGDLQGTYSIDANGEVTQETTGCE